MEKLTRQQKRNAERRLKKDRFPFSRQEHLKLYRYLKENPEYIAQSDIDAGLISTNLPDGEFKNVDVVEFYKILQNLEDKNVQETCNSETDMRENV